MESYTHSVQLDKDKCIGCTGCLTRCPTEAIRVRNGKAVINNSKCIDCGLCIKVCEHHAKNAITQKIGIINDYKYKVAIPAPTLYAQFRNLTDVNAILTALKNMGFDDVLEVSLGAELVTEATKKYISKHKPKMPVISSACPAIVRLICMRFPTLIENIIPMLAPIEITAEIAKDYLVEKGVKREDIGVFFISPCAAKNTYRINPLGIEKSAVDGVISIQDIFMGLRNNLTKLDKVEKLVQSSDKGVDWALTGGESKGVNIDNAIAVDGVENVIRVLEEVENGQLSDVEYIEGLACIGGCVGGPLTVVNSFVAKNRLRKVEKVIKALPDTEKREWIPISRKINYEFTKKLEAMDTMQLDADMRIALEKMNQIQETYAKLPLIDCGSCGAPTCKALAEDIVQGSANEEDCIFMLRRKVTELAESMVNLSSKIPQTFSSGK